MNELTQSRLASALTFLVGAWVAITPAWISMSSGAMASMLSVGILLAALSVVQYYIKSSWPSWLNGILAIYLFLSVFFYTMSAGAVWSAVLSALAVVVLAIWDGLEIENYTMHHHAAT